MPQREKLLLIFLNCLWGASFVAVKTSLEYFPPFVLLAMKLTVVSLFAAIGIAKFPKIKLSTLLAMVGLYHLGYHILLYSSMRDGLASGTSVVLIQTAIPFTSIFSAYFLRDKLRYNHIIGIIITFTGLLVIFGAPSISGHWSGFIMIMLAAISLAGHNIMVKAHHHLNMFNLIVWESVLALPMVWAIGSYFHPGVNLKFILAAPTEAWYGVIFVTLIVTLFIQLIWYKLFARHSAHLVASYSFITPVAGIVAGSLIGKEKLSYIIVLGSLIILIGVMIINRSPRKKKGTEPTPMV